MSGYGRGGGAGGTSGDIAGAPVTVLFVWEWDEGVAVLCAVAESDER